jgi:hypothetical protein
MTSAGLCSRNYCARTYYVSTDNKLAVVPDDYIEVSNENDWGASVALRIFVYGAFLPELTGKSHR